MKKITSVEPHLMDDNLVLSFDIDWIRMFKGIPRFDVFIDQGKRLHLISKEEIK